MSVMTLHTQDQRTVSFDGELIDQQSATVRVGESADGRLAIRVYAVRAGGFVPVVEFNSVSTDVDDVLDAERVDLIKDVECFFLLFEPTDHLNSPACAPQFPSVDADQKFRKDLMREYDEMVNKILDALTDYQTANPGCEVNSIPPTSQASRIWNFFGLASE